MSITQFNATYVQEEDRVMFRFNTSASQEYRLWFTRLVVREHPVEQATQFPLGADPVTEPEAAADATSASPKKLLH